MISVILNGEKTELVAEQPLSEAIKQWGYADGPFAVAVNETFVARTDHGTTVIRSGDQIEIVSPIQGG
jgi:sulfur carrier protein